MGRRSRTPIEFTILDAISLGVIPDAHRTSAIAAFLIALDEDLPTPVVGARKLASFLTPDPETENKLVIDIFTEIGRQLEIKIDRIDAKHRLRQSLAMGSQLPIRERVNRVCRRRFGSTSTWMPIGGVSRKIDDPTFNWMHRTTDDLLVAGVDGSVGRELVVGFVYRDRHGGPSRFGKLPRRPMSMGDLYAILGLHPRLLTSKNIKVDWARRSFVVGETNHLPWVYP